MNYLNTRLTTYLSLLFFTFGVNTMQAQTAHDYELSLHQGVWQPETNGTIITALQTNNGVEKMALPFTFNYCGVNYDTIGVSSNGLIRFNATTTVNSNTLANLASINPALMVMWDYLQAPSSTPTWHVSGTVPNRVFTMQWLNIGFPSALTTNFSMQCRLYETSNVIEYVYGPSSTPPSSTGTATVGLVDQFSNYQSLDNLTANAKARTTRFETNIANDATIAYGQVFRWTPPINCATASLDLAKLTTAPTVCVSDIIELQMDFSQLKAKPYGLTFQYQYKEINGSNWINIGAQSTGTIVPDATYYYVNDGKDKYFRAEIYCNNNLEAVTDSVLVTVSAPKTPTSLDVTRCGIGETTLTANGQNLYWFKNGTSSVVLSEGQTFTTPRLYDTAVYYVASIVNRQSKIEKVNDYTTITNSATYGPYNNGNMSSVFQYLIYASELHDLGYAAGNMYSISFEVLQPSLEATGHLSIALKNTLTSNLTKPEYTDLQTVFSEDGYVAVSGLNKHEFSAPFYWDGVSNILVSICNDRTTKATGSDVMRTGYTYVSGRNPALYYNNASTTGQCTYSSPTTSSYRPFMYLERISGCESPRVAVSANVKPAPSFQAKALKENACLGDAVQLTASSVDNSNYQYLWEQSTAYSNTYTVFPYLDTNYYVVKAVDSVLGSSFYGCEAYDTLRVNVVPNPEVRISPDQINVTCPGEVVPLTAISKTAVQYQWFHNGTIVRGGNASFHGAAFPGTYTVLVTDANGCDSLSGPVEKIESKLPVASIAYNSNLEFCEGSSVILKIPNGDTNFKYQWYHNGLPLTNGLDSFLEVEEGGQYAVKVEDKLYGCMAEGDTIEVKVFNLPTPTVTRDNTVLTTGQYVKYAWLRNNQYLSGENKETITVSQPGVYCVEVTDSNGCMARSAIVNMFNLGIEAYPNYIINVYPNPTNDLLNIETDETVNIELLNMSGQIVYKKDQVTKIQINNLNSGLYILNIKNQEGRTISSHKVTKF